MKYGLRYNHSSHFYDTVHNHIMYDVTYNYKQSGLYKTKDSRSQSNYRNKAALQQGYPNALDPPEAGGNYYLPNYLCCTDISKTTVAFMCNWI